MIEPSQVRERASKLYYDIKRRSAPTYWQNGRMKGQMRWAGVPVPYSSAEFATWLLTEVGCRAFLCPYCNAPIDVLSMTLDHDVPLHQPGGTNLWANLVPCCADCNNIKGELTGEQYLLFRKLMRQLHPDAEANILMRVRAGGGALKATQRLIILEAELAKYRPRALKGRSKPSLVTSDEPF
jgi:5-methylcytosine-specific restriction endonuclease McrA